MSLSPALSVGSYTHQYYSQGYLIYQHRGQAGKVCAAQLEQSLGAEQTEVFIRSLANSTCDHLGYRDLAWAAITRDQEEAEVSHCRMRISHVIIIIMIRSSMSVWSLWRPETVSR